VCSALAGAALFPQPASPVQQTRTLQAPVEIVDARGKVLFQFGSDERGPVFRQLDQAGRPAARLDLAGGGARLTLFQSGEAGVVVISTGRGGRVETYDQRGRSAAELVAEVDQGAVRVFRRSDVPSGSLFASDDGGRSC
jgi:hypothetical protein